MKLKGEVDGLMPKENGGAPVALFVGEVLAGPVMPNEKPLIGEPVFSPVLLKGVAIFGGVSVGAGTPRENPLLGGELTLLVLAAKAEFVLKLNPLLGGETDSLDGGLTPKVNACFGDVASALAGKRAEFEVGVDVAPNENPLVGVVDVLGEFELLADDCPNSPEFVVLVIPNG